MPYRALRHLSAQTSVASWLLSLPLEEVFDPTGAGDSFAGAMMGYMANVGRVDFISLRNAIVYGTVLSSFTIGDFSIHGLNKIDKNQVEERYIALRKVTQF